MHKNCGTKTIARPVVVTKKINNDDYLLMITQDDIAVKNEYILWASGMLLAEGLAGPGLYCRRMGERVQKVLNLGAQNTLL